MLCGRALRFGGNVERAAAVFRYCTVQRHYYLQQQGEKKLRTTTRNHPIGLYAKALQATQASKQSLGQNCRKRSRSRRLIRLIPAIAKGKRRSQQIPETTPARRVTNAGTHCYLASSRERSAFPLTAAPAVELKRTWVEEVRLRLDSPTATPSVPAPLINLRQFMPGSWLESRTAGLVLPAGLDAARHRLSGWHLAERSDP